DPAHPRPYAGHPHAVGRGPVAALRRAAARRHRGRAEAHAGRRRGQRRAPRRARLPGSAGRGAGDAVLAVLSARERSARSLGRARGAVAFGEGTAARQSTAHAWLTHDAPGATPVSQGPVPLLPSATRTARRAPRAPEWRELRPSASSPS